PVLFRRIASKIDPTIRLDVQQPIRTPRNSLVSKGGELERAVELAAIKARPRGAVFVLVDSDTDCPATLAPKLLARAQNAAMGLPVYVVLPKFEFESWFIAAAVSIRGKRGLSVDLAPPENPEEIRGAKEWLAKRMHGPYSETLDQPALAAIFDLNQARAAASFDKCYRDVQLLIGHFRTV